MRQTGKLNTEMPFLDNREYRGVISSTFDNNGEATTNRIFERDQDRSWSRTPRVGNKDESFSYK